MASDGDHDDRGVGGSPSPLTACFRFLAGRPLANRESRDREIGAAEGVPALGLDGLSSTAYGPEAALTILTAAGAAGLANLGPVMLVILALLGILFMSDGQTIAADPQSGGAYTVSQDNLGVNASLLPGRGADDRLRADRRRRNLRRRRRLHFGGARRASSTRCRSVSACWRCSTMTNLRGNWRTPAGYSPPPTYLFIGCFAVVLHHRRLCRGNERRPPACRGAAAGAAHGRRGGRAMAPLARVRPLAGRR